MLFQLNLYDYKIVLEVIDVNNLIVDIINLI